MGFYGIKHDYDQQLRQLQQTILQLQTARSNSTYTELALPQTTHLSTLGNFIVQSVQSGQYVANCIGEYFKRQCFQPVLYQLSPIIQAYSSLPPTITQLKQGSASLLTVGQRLLMCNLLGLWVCGRNLRGGAWGMLRGMGRGVLALGVTSWLLVPQMSERYVGWAAGVL